MRRAGGRSSGRHLAPGAILSRMSVRSKRSVVEAMSLPHLQCRRAFHPRAPRRRHRKFRSRRRFCRVCFVNRWSHPDTAAGGHSPEAIARLQAVLGGHSASNVEIMTPEHHDLVLGDHLPCAPPHRLQHRRHGGGYGEGDAGRGHQILCRWFSRFHPHRGFRSDDVARRVPDTTRTRCSKCSAASARICRC